MRRKNQYQEVKQLPKGAITVLEYADEIGLSTQALYNQIRRNKNKGWKIVVWKGWNWVIKNV